MRVTHFNIHHLSAFIISAIRKGRINTRIALPHKEFDKQREKVRKQFAEQFTERDGT
jgi:hypothetical protein